MSDIKNLVLDSDESVLWTSKPNSGPILIVGLLWMLFFSGIVTFAYNFVPVSEAVYWATIIVLNSIGATHFVLAATQTRYVITDKRLFVHDGGIRPATASISRDDITELHAQRGRTESLLNTGRIVFRTDKDKMLTLSSMASYESIGLKVINYFPDAKLKREQNSSTQVKGVTWPRSFL